MVHRAIRLPPPLQQSDGMGGKTLATARIAETVGCRRPNVDLALTDRLLQPVAHLAAVGSDSRLFADEDAVRIHERVAGRSHLGVGLGEHRERRDTPEAFVARREEAADVAEAGCSEQRVDERMCDDVPVGMSSEPARMIDGNPAEHEWDALLEGVGIDADPDPEIH
jgi:hypothetical protein